MYVIQISKLLNKDEESGSLIVIPQYIIIIKILCAASSFLIAFMLFTKVKYITKLILIVLTLLLLTITFDIYSYGVFMFVLSGENLIMLILLIITFFMKDSY
ncbi:hypothetical protein DCC35_19840 [Mangrovivirga cuniculi]|uniref:Uncharacterized protein n=1 Tax=Mangrovivirga cuniculi TaxID=2715131 RepID=A0A4D7K7W2_9BACT|nr:hypothetical protein DCC35_19840 [Mangrovivirga cuniculi]